MEKDTKVKKYSKFGFSMNKVSNKIKVLFSVISNKTKVLINKISNKSKIRYNKITHKLKNLSKYDMRKYVWTGFFIFGFILLVNVFIMSLYLADSEYQFPVLDNAYVDSVLPGQDINQKLNLGIVRVKEFKVEEIQVGDKIVIDGDFNIDVFWVENVVEINPVTKEIQATYDQATINSFRYDEIVGVYVEEANLMGTLYYSASFTEGFIFLTISHAILLYMYFHLFLQKKTR